MSYDAGNPAFFEEDRLRARVRELEAEVGKQRGWLTTVRIALHQAIGSLTHGGGRGHIAACLEGVLQNITPPPTTEGSAATPEED